MSASSNNGRLIYGIQLCLFLFLAVFFSRLSYAGTLSCSVTTAAACTDTVILRMSGATNAHAELPSQSTAAYASTVVCCSGVTGLSNACTGTFATILKLSSATNAHAEQNSQSNYATSTCLQVPSGGSVSVGYQATNCSGFDTTLASMKAITNSHVGDATAYTEYKICGTATGSVAQTLTFAISDNTIGFGNLSTGGARFATGDTNGTSTEAEAHTFLASTNAGSGYVITVRGATLTNGGFSINSIGNTNTSSTIATEQFGLRLVATGGSGVATTPYAAAGGFAYAASATSTSQVASTSTGDDITTTYSARYVANIAGTTEPGDYNAALTYTITANF